MTDAVYAFFIDWNNDGDYSDTGETVTSRVLSRSPVSFVMGRDQARALSAIAPGQVDFELDNRSGDYSPDNESSPLYTNLEPGKPFLIQATHSAVTYDLFRGFIDNYELKPDLEDRSVSMTALDLLQKFSEANIYTPLYESVQTGEAINYLLDAMGWPTASRDIDQGATTIRWWWGDGSSALEILNKITDSEGPPSFAYVAPNGNFTFRDRHHRITRTASKTSQATFRGTGTEPNFAKGMSYEIGWRDIVNDISVEVPEREPLELGQVWTTEDTITLTTGETRIIEVKTDDPFFGAVTPVAGTDFTLVSGSVTVALSDLSGQKTTITLTCSSTATLTGLQLRARSVPVARTYAITQRDTESQNKHGVRSLQDNDPSFVGRNDADSVARLIIGQRANRLPVVYITVNSGNDTRIDQILQRSLSDMIHIIETANVYIDDDFYIERIEHNIDQAGELHTATFGCEKAYRYAPISTTFFTFDVASKGFDDGVFTDLGNVPSTTVLILDDSGNNGKLDTAGLGF